MARTKSRSGKPAHRLVWRDSGLFSMLETDAGFRLWFRGYSDSPYWLLTYRQTPLGTFRRIRSAKLYARRWYRAYVLAQVPR